MIYPKCLYKTREITKVVKNETEHKFWAAAGWKDIWTDEEPHDWKPKESEKIVVAEIIESKPVKKAVKRVIKKRKR